MTRMAPSGFTGRATPDPKVAAGLAALRAEAPPGLAPAVLFAAGLADAWAPLPTAIGEILVAWNGRGVSAVALADEAPDFERRFRAEHGRAIYNASEVPPALAAAITRRLGGDRRARIDLDLRGATDFEAAVWRKALDIPHGEVRPYGWVAAEIGRPNAVRAVGTALGHNPIPLVVPCHRVVRSDGRIGEYSMGGPDRKRAILRAEGLDPAELEALATKGIRYLASNTTRIVCLPSCHNARRIRPSHRVAFRSLREAATAGYRPCRACRPAAPAAAA